MKKIAISVQKLIISTTSPISVQYMLIDEGKIDELNLEHFMGEKNPFGIVEIKDPRIAEEFYSCIKLYNSIASGNDIMRLKLFLLSEVKRILEERFHQCGGDIFASPIEIKGGM